MTRPTGCPACHLRVTWALTARGRWQPLNWAPDPAGLIAAFQDAHGTWRARHAPEGEPVLAPEKRYMPHAATCPSRARQPAEPQPGLTGVTFLDTWRQARADRAKTGRNRRARG